MKKCIVMLLLLAALPAVAWAQEPSNAELYQMIKQMEQKFEAAIGEASKAKAEAAKAKEEAALAKQEAAMAKEELARLKAVPATAAPAESLIRAAETEPGVEASVELVYLRPSRSNLDFVINDPNTDSSPEGDSDTLDPDYSGGVRLGLSYDFGSGADVGIRFMGLKTSDSESETAPAGGTLWANWLHADENNLSGDDIDSAKARYQLEHYVVDLVAGQWLDVGQHFGLRLEAGLRYASMSQDLDILYDDGSDRADISNENDFSGWGPRIGVGFDWRVGRGFNVFSSLAGSLLIGDFDLSLRQVDNGDDPQADVKESIDNRLVPVVEMRIGMGYEHQLNNGWSVGAKAGYEWQNWFNMVTAKRFPDDVHEGAMSSDTTDIGLDGFFLEGFVNF